MDTSAEEDPRIAVFKELYIRNEARLASLFEPGESVEEPPGASASRVVKRKARTIDEDDYDDDDDEPNEAHVSPLRNRSSVHPLASAVHMSRGLSQTSSNSNTGKKTTEQARQKLEEERKSVEDAAKSTFHTLFYTLENDRDAMLEQRKLDESDRKVEAELEPNNQAAYSHGTLSQTNLGASSLTLKNLIRRIDSQRDKVRASDMELRTLMSEVRKNRSKWASEDKVGQEELYEACDKVLSELKGQTEHSTYFLNKVNKKDAPDYHLGMFCLSWSTC